MSYQLDDFASQANIVVRKFFRDPTEATELNQLRIALGADASTHDTTLDTPARSTGLQPGAATNSPFINEMLLLINRGKAGNLSTISMANILGSIAPPTAPVNTVPPTITYTSGGSGAGTQPGAVYARGTGTWTPGGGVPSQQWYRGATPIAGSTGVSYSTQAADSGLSISCHVIMTLNGASSAPVASNSVAIT